MSDCPIFEVIEQKLSLSDTQSPNLGEDHSEVSVMRELPILRLQEEGFRENEQGGSLYFGHKLQLPLT